jgi:uncharacterized protein (TIGR02328 family)
MRLWHYKLLPYLPDAQFKGQLRELVAIMHDWRYKGTTNHLLINKVMEYDKSHLTTYFMKYCYWYGQRYHKSVSTKYALEFQDFCPEVIGFVDTPIFDGWHNKEYLRVCMANLYEKHFFGVGKSRITDEEWQRLLDGYKTITGEKYQI